MQHNKENEHQLRGLMGILNFQSINELFPTNDEWSAVQREISSESPNMQPATKRLKPNSPVLPNQNTPTITTNPITSASTEQNPPAPTLQPPPPPQEVLDIEDDSVAEKDGMADLKAENAKLQREVSALREEVEHLKGQLTTARASKLGIKN